MVCNTRKIIPRNTHSLCGYCYMLLLDVFRFVYILLDLTFSKKLPVAMSYTGCLQGKFINKKTTVVEWKHFIVHYRILTTRNFSVHYNTSIRYFNWIPKKYHTAMIKCFNKILQYSTNRKLIQVNASIKIVNTEQQLSSSNLVLSLWQNFNHSLTHTDTSKASILTMLLQI